MEFSRQKYWSGLPFLPPGYLSYPEIQSATPASPSLAGGFFYLGSPSMSLPCKLAAGREHTYMDSLWWSNREKNGAKTYLRTGLWDFSGGPVVDFAFQCGSMRSFPPQGAGFRQASQPKTMNNSNIATNSIKTSKNGPYQKKSIRERESVPKSPGWVTEPFRTLFHNFIHK